MNESLVVQGRLVGPPDLALIRHWLEQNPGWSRWRLSQVLATHWDWRNGVGQLKDMAARTLLLKLHQRGLIALPPPQMPTNRMRCQPQLPATGEGEDRPLDCPLAQLGALTLHEVSAQAAERAWVRAALGRHHYFRCGGAVGENLQYVARDGQGQPLACLVFGAAAWKCQARDQFIGWSGEQQKRNLGLLANNTRFLILPSVRVPHLASWLLGRVSRRLAATGKPSMAIRSLRWRRLWNASVFGARPIARPTGWPSAAPRPDPPRPAHLYSSAGQRRLSLSVAAGLSGKR